MYFDLSAFNDILFLSLGVAPKAMVLGFISFIVGLTAAGLLNYFKSI